MNKKGMEALREMLEVTPLILPKLKYCPQISVIYSLLINFMSKAESVAIFSFLYQKSLDFDFEFNHIGSGDHNFIRLYFPLAKEEMTQ